MKFSVLLLKRLLLYTPAVYSDGTIPIASSNRPNPWAISTQNGYYRSGRSKLESFVCC